MLNTDDFRNNIKYSALCEAIDMKETLWLNPNLLSYTESASMLPITKSDINKADATLHKFASLIAEIFPETRQSQGIIESPLQEISSMKCELSKLCKTKIEGTLLLKMDSHLPISGSIKARGGIYEVLKYAEHLAVTYFELSPDDDYKIMASEKYKNFFSNYTIQVGSTGNLGLGIGIMSAALGFNVIVHMSQDAKAWKKQMLRQNGATVIEYKSDYCKAVEEGRKSSLANPMSYFVDDENSMNLFMGYATAPNRLYEQLNNMNITATSSHPIFVYLPCGIGGAPGGIAYGLKAIYGDNVHCFFVEPTHAPCMLIGMATGLHDNVSVEDVGIDGRTHADGLAVGRPSKLVGKLMTNLLSGICTVDDYKLYDYLRMLHDTESIDIEPSACSAFSGPVMLLNSQQGKSYLKKHNLSDCTENITHIVWATGGSLVPPAVFEEYMRTYL